MSRTVKLYLLPLVILSAVTLPHLEQGDFRRDTVNYAAIGHYMWNGGSLLVPQIGPEKPYFHKPPLALWIHGLFLKLCGTNLAVARLPSILAAAGVIVFSMLSLRNLGTRREAITSGIVLALTYEFFRRTREISLDLWQLLFVMIAVWLVTIAIRNRQRMPLVLCGVPIGLALLCKPLVALFVFPIFVIWLAIAGQAGLILRLFIGALPIALVVAAPWHLYMYSLFGEGFLHGYFQREIVEHPAQSQQRTFAFYYLAENLRTYWPWMLALFYACYLAIFKRGRFQPRHREIFLLATIWVLLCLVGLSSFADKKPNYALPLYPMLSWICAWGICRISSPTLRGWYSRGLPGLAATFAVVLLVTALAPVRFQEPPEKNWVAVIDWMKANKIDSAQLAYANLELNDICYVYLKTGNWMKSLQSAEADPEWRNGKRLIVTKLRRNSDPLAEQNEIIFSAGPVHVVAEAR
jgi:4-amino-4-deoxy-L-arabinose transferase-like glycosyltransferase